MSGYDDAMVWGRIAADPKGYAERLTALKAEREAIAAERAALEQSRTALAQTVAEVDKRVAAVSERKLAAHTKEQRNEAIQNWLVDFAREQREVGDQIKIRLRRHSGLLQHFNPTLQTLPDGWDAIDAAVFGRPADDHRDEHNVDIVTEPVEGAVGGVTLSRSRPASAAERRAQRRAAERLA